MIEEVTEVIEVPLRIPGSKVEYEVRVTLGEKVGGPQHDVYHVLSVSPAESLVRLNIAEGTALVLKEGVESGTLTGRREAGLEAVRRLSAKDPQAMVGVVPLYAMGTKDHLLAKFGKHLQILDGVFAYDLMPYAGATLSDTIRMQTTSFWGSGGQAAAVAAMLPSARSLAAIFALEADKDDQFGELAAHRDIKPSNIFVLPQGSLEFDQTLLSLPFWPDMPLVRIGDFGLLYFSSKDIQATATNNRPKSGYWSDPADWSDSFARKNPQDLDTWAYAATLFFALTGQHPWVEVEKGITQNMPAMEAAFRMTRQSTPDSPLFASLDPRIAAAIRGCLLPAGDRAPLSELIEAMELFAAGEIEAARQRAWNGRIAKELAKERDLASQRAIAAERRAQDAIARAEARARAEADDRVRAERRSKDEAVRQAGAQMKSLWLNESLMRSNVEEQLRAEQRERGQDSARATSELAAAVAQARAEERQRAEADVRDAITRAEAQRETEREAEKEKLAELTARADASDQALSKLKAAGEEGKPQKDPSGIGVLLATCAGLLIVIGAFWTLAASTVAAGAPFARIGESINMVNGYLQATGTMHLGRLARDGFVDRNHGVFIKTTQTPCPPDSGTCYTAELVAVLPTDSNPGGSSFLKTPSPQDPPTRGAANPNGSCPHGIWISAALVDKDGKVLETTNLVQPDLSPTKTATSNLTFHAADAEGNILQYTLAQCIP